MKVARVSTLGIALLLACGESAFEQVGYFKDGARNRVSTVTYDASSVSEEQIREYAVRQMNTRGQVTAVYLYPRGGARPPAGRLTQAANLFRANEIIAGGPQPRYAFMRYLNGNTEFVSCVENRGHSLCQTD